MGPTALQNSLTASPQGRTLTIASPARAQAPGAVRAWAVGQVLSATVVTPGTAGAPSALRVAGETLQAETRVPLQAGQALRLEVTHAGPPAVLKVLGPGPADDLDSLSARLLRASLPVQRPMAESLAALQRVSEQPFSRRVSDLPDAARALLSDLLASLPRPRDAAEGSRLAAMFRASGLFHEAHSARQDQQAATGAGARAPGQDPGASDFKARVASVADALREAVASGSRDGPAREADSALRAVLARIETNQALSARGSQDQGALWRTDLPFADERGAQSAALTIRRKPARGDGGEAQGGASDWVVELHVQPPGRGPLHARVSLASGAVSALFTTEDAVLLDRLEARSGELERRLEGEALEVGGVRWRCARPPGEDLPGVMDAVMDSLVDERA